MHYRSKPHQPRNDLVPVRTSRVLFDATQRQRPQPYFAAGVRPVYTPYHRSPVTIADMLWAATALNQQRTAEQEWDDDDVAESRAAEAAEISAANLDRYASALAL